MPEDRKANLNDCREATRLDEAASAAGKFLRQAQEALPSVIGHCDWWAGNVRWDGDRVLVVHDWDSLVVLPEAAVAGVAAAVHEEAATVNESAVFLNAYEAERGCRWTPQERLRLAGLAAP